MKKKRVLIVEDDYDLTYMIKKYFINEQYEVENVLSSLTSALENMRETLYKQQQEQKQFEISRKHFIDNISHDLKAPLASISAYVEALKDGFW